MAKKEKVKKKGWCLKTFFVIAGMLIVVGIFSPDLENEKDDKNSDVKQSTSEQAKASENISTSSTEPEAAASDVPREYQSALKTAQNYNNTMPMSKQGLYDQLTSEYGEKFSAEAAQYAIDNLNADWNANALASAESYSDTMHMSKQGIYDQLTSENGEKFTAEEAQYAIDNIEADWNANALATAKSYQESMDMSIEAIRDQLTSEYGEKFTAEEADYAVLNLN